MKKWILIILILSLSSCSPAEVAEVLTPTDTPIPPTATSTHTPTATPTLEPTETSTPEPSRTATLEPEMRIQLLNNYGDINWLLFFKPFDSTGLQESNTSFQINNTQYYLSSSEVQDMISRYGGIIVDFDENVDIFKTDYLGITYKLLDPTSNHVVFELTTPIEVANWSYTGILHLPVDTSIFGSDFWTLGSADKDLGDSVIDFFGNTTPRRWRYTDQGTLFQYPGVGENHAGAVDLGFTDGNPETQADVYSFCTPCKLVRIPFGTHSDDGQTWNEYNILFELPIKLVDEDPNLNGDRLVAYVGHLISVDSNFQSSYHTGELVPLGIVIGKIWDRPGENRDAHVHFGVYDIDQPGDPAYPGDSNFINIDIIQLVIPSQRDLLNPLSYPDY